MARRMPEPRFRVGEDFEAQWPGASRLATECVLNLGYLCDRFSAYVESLARRCGIPSAAAFNVLTILDGAGEPLPPSTIAARMVLTRGTVTGILDSLERRGLLRRMRHGADGRMRLVAITPEGISRARQVRVELHQAEKRLLGGLTPAQQRQLLRLVAVLQTRLPADA
jgi:DNA-binding MarR family transcriptional regulator